MPIYAYRCSHCGHAQDVLQKMSDAVLTTCPACGAEAYVKQLTAAAEPWRPWRAYAVMQLWHHLETPT